MFSTKDGGLTWHEQYIPYSGYRGFLRVLQFVDRNHGWCSDGDDINFYRTIDGGKSWQKIPFENYSFDINGIQSFFFINKDVGWAGGFLGGDIAKTENGGCTWKFQESLNSFAIESLCFINKGLGWAISGNSILRYTNKDTSTNTDFSHSEIVQNAGVFPNPFNNGTTIYFYLSRTQKVSVQIFDILGRQIDTLYEGWAEKGLQTIRWDAKGFPNGVYLIKLKCEDHTRTSDVLW